ncbi:MAG: hypothetical protein AB1646_21875 [Thermodesulfobacteriota bacterium]
MEGIRVRVDPERQLLILECDISTERRVSRGARSILYCTSEGNQSALLNGEPYKGVRYNISVFRNLTDAEKQQIKPDRSARWPFP